MRFLHFLLLVCSLAATATATAEDATEFFEKRIRPVLVERCHECHAGIRHKGGLSLENRAAALQGGDSGPAIIAGKPAESLLMKAIHQQNADLAMPPQKAGAKLSPETLANFEKWIAEGAVWPDSGPPKQDLRQHWAFQPVRDYPIPETKNAAWAKMPLDAFLLAEMEKNGLQPAPQADPDVLCRRAYFTLTGLPPEPQRVLDFTSEIAAKGFEAAWEALIDELLASPHFGEKWTQHWLDLMRHADGKGSEYDYPIPGAWRYRDYLVRAANANLPYNTLVNEHLQGDLLPPRVVDGRNEAILATGWWQLGEAVNSPVDLANDEVDRMESQIDTLGKAFHGLTISCARCHDHKFDPISMRDYYALSGVVAASPLLRGWANEPALEEAAKPLDASRTAFDAAQPPAAGYSEPAWEWSEGTVLGDFAERLPDGWLLAGHGEFVKPDAAVRRGVRPGLWSGLLSRKLPILLRSPTFKIEHDYLNVLACGKESMIQVIVGNYHIIKNPLYGQFKGEIKHADWVWHRVDLRRWRGMRCVLELHTGKAHSDVDVLNVEDTPQAQLGVRAVVLSNGPPLAVPPLPPLPALPRWPGDAALEAKIPLPERFLGLSESAGWDVPVLQRGDAAKPLPGGVPRHYLEIFPALQRPVAGGSGRRELASAMLADENPLTHRVFVNRLWQHVFGRGLVATPDNFGHLGTPPSHPELLDFLTIRFRRVHQTRPKAALREMLLSRAWRMASSPPPTKDPDNVWVSVFPLHRLEAEAVRDAILAVAENLDRSLGGAPVPIFHRLEKATEMGPPCGPVDGARRRSLYLERRRNFPQRFLDVFDRPSPQSTMGRREVTNVPAQSLALLNDPFVVEQAQHWGRRMREAPGTSEERLAHMQFRALGRPPLPEETAQLRELLTDPSLEENWSAVALALFNQKEFIYVR